MKGMLGSIGLSLLLVTTAAFAHHGWSEYDSSKSLVLNGTIEESGYSHPHGFVRLKTADKTLDRRPRTALAHGESRPFPGHAECGRRGHRGRLSESHQA